MVFGCHCLAVFTCHLRSKRGVFAPLNGQVQQSWGPGNVDPWTDRDPPQLEKKMKRLGGWLWARHALVLLGGTERSGVSSNNTLCIGGEGGLALKLVAQCSCMLASVAGNLNRSVPFSSRAVGLMSRHVTSP